MAFAPTSSWTPPAAAVHAAYTTQLCRRSASIHISSSTMVMEKSFRTSSNPQFPESHESIHSRLGIKALWDTEVLSQAKSHRMNLLDHSIEEHAPLSTTVSDDVNTTDSPSVLAPKPWDTTTGAQAVSFLGHRMRSLRQRHTLLMRSQEECRRITALFSKTFYMGTSLLSPVKRQAVWAIYTWCRRTDDLVDGPRVTQRSHKLREVLTDWERRLENIFEGRAFDSLDLALVDALGNFPDIVIDPFRDMVKGMIMDVEQDRFETFDDLYLYCYRVAATVGLMTLPVMGTATPGRDGLRDAVEPAIALGIGLQLTNILRDVGEDRLRGRIYLPMEDLRRFNYTEEDLFNCVVDNRYRALMRFEIARARRYFRQAQSGVRLLSADSRLPVQASLDMYSQILDVIEENGYDNFNRRAYVSKTKKMLTVPVSYLRSRESETWKMLLNAVELLAGENKHAF